MKHEMGRVLLWLSCRIRWMGERLETKAVRMLPEKEQFAWFDVWQERAASWQRVATQWHRAKRGLPVEPHS